MIQIRNIHKTFGNNTILRGVDLDVAKGQVVVILGPSGSGKTTFLRCLNALEIPEQGSICFEREPIVSINFATQHSKKDILALRRKSGMVFQQYNLFPHKTALENIMEAPVQVQGKPKAQAREEALALQPELMLFDEPTSALDPELVQDVLNTMKALATEGWTMIVVTHEIKFALDVADVVVVMDGGVIVEQGSPETLFANPQHERTKSFLSRLKAE